MSHLMTPQQRNDTVNHVVWRPLGIPLGNPQEHFAGTHNDLAVAALITATTAVAAANLMSPQQRTKDTEQSLMSLTLPQLKQRCAALGTPVTGNKPKLISMILDPSTNQKKKAKAPGSGIKKQRTKAPKLFRAGEKCKECGDEARPPGYTRRSLCIATLPRPLPRLPQRAPREVGRVSAHSVLPRNAGWRGRAQVWRTLRGVLGLRALRGLRRVLPGGRDQPYVKPVPVVPVRRR